MPPAWSALAAYRAHCIAGLGNGWREHPAMRGVTQEAVDRTIAAIEAAASVEAIEAALAALVPPAAPGGN